MKKNDTITYNTRFNRGPVSTKTIVYANINTDFMMGDSFGLLKTPEEFNYMVNSGLEGMVKSLRGKRFIVFFIGEWRDISEPAKVLCLAQKYGFSIIPIPDEATGWRLIEAYSDGQVVPVGDISSLPAPRLQAVGGVLERFWTLEGTQGVMKVTSIKYIDYFWAEREQKSFPQIIAEEGPKYRYYGLIYETQGIPQDKPTINSLRTACEAVGGLFRTTTEWTLRTDRHNLAEDLWKRFLGDINKQFGGK